jgi:hypothetical protein
VLRSDGVRQRRDAARPRRHRVDVADRARLQRRAVTAVVIGEKLALESRDVDADRTFGLARAALETEIEDLAHAFVAEPRLSEPSGHREPQHVRAAAGRVLFFPRRHERRAHRAVQRLAADAEPAAHLHGATHAAVLRVVEERRRIGRRIAGAVTQVRRQRRRVDDFSRIEDAVRIERVLHGPERFVQDRPRTFSA